MIKFRMPSLGADMEAGTLREWKLKPGDRVKRGDIIALVETQKGLIEIEVFEEGVIDSLVIKEEDKVPVGTVMALIIPDTVEAESKKETTEPFRKGEPAFSITDQKTPLSKSTHGIKASPLAKKMAEALGVDLSLLHGTGEQGAITRDDVEKYLAERNGSPKKATGVSGESIRQGVAAAMSKSNREIPHYYLEQKIDMTHALAWLRETNKAKPIQSRLLPVVLLIKAVARALTVVPELNAVWDHGLVLKDEINPGFVVSVRGGGVMIPAIRQADKKSLSEIMESLNDLIPRARALTLRSSELSESTITISSLGENSADKVFGVIYPPQVAIIGFGNTGEEPRAVNGKVEVRSVIHVTLAGDHRATDGHTGSRYLVSLKDFLQRPEEL